MSDGTPKAKTLRELTNQDPTVADTFLELAYQGTYYDDRSIAIVETSRLESILQEYLLTKLVGLSSTDVGHLFSEYDAPLRSLHSKILIGYAIGAFGKKTRLDLKHIKEIRNTFAHSRRPISFLTEPIPERCALLRWSRET